MAFPNVRINQIGGRSGRPLAGFDHYSSLKFYGTAPAVSGKWKTYPGPPAIKIQQMFSELDAISAGIIPFSENIAATAKYAINTVGSTDDTFELKVEIPIANGAKDVVSLGVYTIPASDDTDAEQAAGYAAVINAGTSSHGFTATSVAKEILITAPKSAGISLNTGTPLEATIQGDLVGTITQFSGGTASQYAAWYYHIKEYFRIHPQGVLFVSIIAASSSFSEIASTVRAAESKIRQIGIYDISTTRGNADNIMGTISAIDAVCKTVQATAPLSAFYSPNIYGLSDLSTYPDQNINTANKCSCVISQDGDAEGALLFVQLGQTIGNIGAKLGSISKSRVSASDAQPIEANNMSNGIENNVPAFGNGQLNSSLTLGLMTQLNDYNYTFFRQFGDTVVGTYWNDNKCCVSRSSDYSNVNDNRTSDKVARICYSTMVPVLNSEVFFNADGTLQDYTIETFKDLITDAVTASMITGFGATPMISGISVTIDPTQQIKVTGELVIDIEINQNGIARTITVNIAYSSLN